jgi:hypothetical protein
VRAAEGRKLVREVVAPLVSDSISKADFRFSSKTLTFARQSHGTHQFIDLGPDVTPRYAPGTLVVLQPTLRVEYESLVPFLERGDVAGSGTSLVQPLAHGGDRKQWEIAEVGEAHWVASDLASEIRNRAIPLLDDLLSPAGLMEAHSVLDPRVLWHDQTYAAVIAAHALAGQATEARAITAKRFLGQGLRIMFPKVAELLQA